MNASMVSVAGIILGGTVNARFLLLPAAVFGFFFQHAVQGWCPPLPVFRRIGNGHAAKSTGRSTR